MTLDFLVSTDPIQERKNKFVQSSCEGRLGDICLCRRIVLGLRHDIAKPEWLYLQSDGVTIAIYIYSPPSSFHVSECC